MVGNGLTGSEVLKIV